MEKVLQMLKKFAPLLALLSIGLFFTPDIVSILTYIYRLSVIGVIVLGSIWFIGEADEWGIFTEINFKDLIDKAKLSGIGSSIVFASIVYLVSTIIKVVIG